jgi:hypothetical protein
VDRDEISGSLERGAPAPGDTSPEESPSFSSEQPGAERETASAFFGVNRRFTPSAAYRAELDLLRDSPAAQVRAYLEQHLHSNRFYIDNGRIWLELPDGANGAVAIWFEPPARYRVGQPAAGSRAGSHALPDGWGTTLCRINLNSWTSGIEARDHDVTCRWCWIRLLAAEIAKAAETLSRNPSTTRRRASQVAIFSEDEDGYSRWLAEHPNGYIINANRTPSPNYLKLHRASCPTISGRPAHGETWTGPYIKVCADQKTALTEWAADEVGGSPEPCQRCGP